MLLPTSLLAMNKPCTVDLIDKQEFVEFLKTQVIYKTLMSYALTSVFAISSESTPRSWLMLNNLLLKSINGKLCFSNDDIAVIKQCADEWIGTHQSALFVKHLLTVGEEK